MTDKNNLRSLSRSIDLYGATRTAAWFGAVYLTNEAISIVHPSPVISFAALTGAWGCLCTSHFAKKKIDNQMRHIRNRKSIASDIFVGTLLSGAGASFLVFDGTQHTRPSALLAMAIGAALYICGRQSIMGAVRREQLAKNNSGSEPTP